MSELERIMHMNEERKKARVARGAEREEREAAAMEVSRTAEDKHRKPYWLYEVC